MDEYSVDRDWGDEDDFDPFWDWDWNDDEDDFYLDPDFDDYDKGDDDEDDDYEDSGGSLIRNSPTPKSPTFGAQLELEEEKQLVLV